MAIDREPVANNDNVDLCRKSRIPSEHNNAKTGRSVSNDAA